MVFNQMDGKRAEWWSHSACLRYVCVSVGRTSRKSVNIKASTTRSFLMPLRRRYLRTVLLIKVEPICVGKQRAERRRAGSLE